MRADARPLRARIDLDAVRRNYAYAKQLAPRARALAVVKANAYGHGAVAVAAALADSADGFAVAAIDEAAELRDAGLRAPILLLEGVFAPDELAQVERLDLELVVHAAHQLDWIQAARPRHPLRCWLKVDTGMHRLGFDPVELPAVRARLQRCGHAVEQVLMTHFANADVPEHPATARQLARFAALERAPGVARSLANSAAILTRPESHADWVRPGLMLYGASPLESAHPAVAPLLPAMTLETEIIAVREVPVGEAVGYGGIFHCPRPTRVGVAAIGYADGYPRHARDGTPVAVAGRRTCLIGRVSMDMITVDLTAIPEVRVGSRVELWGRQILATEVAAWSDTIAYQLFTGLGRRVRRENA